MPIPALLIPVLTTLATKGLDLIGNAILSKGKDVVEKELGVDIESNLATEEGLETLRQAQFAHEEKLVEMALEEKKLDVEYYKLDQQDRDSARQREVDVMRAASEGDWFNHSIASMLALCVIIGGGLFLYFSNEADIKYGVIALMSSVLTYYFGSSKTSSNKDAVINQLSKGK
jgi:hypothetical protein